MKNPLLILLAIAIMVGLGWGGYRLTQNTETMAPKEEVMTPKPSDTMMTEGKYVEYSKQTLDQAASGRRVLFFYASWCPTCQPADASFTQNESQIPKDVTVIRVNYNDSETDQEEKALAAKYGITYQHTFVQIDSTGQEVTKWNGGQINELLAHIQ